MILRLIIALLLLPSLVFAGQGMGPGPGFKTYSAGSFSCNSTAFITQDTHDNSYSLGSESGIYYSGFVNTSATPFVLCSISLYAREDGSLSGKTLYIERWTVNSSTKYLTAKQADIANIDATLFPSTIGYYTISFGEEISIGENEALVFTFREITGATNKLTIAYKGATSTIANQYSNAWASGLSPFTTAVVQDLRVKYYAPN